MKKKVTNREKDTYALKMQPMSISDQIGGILALIGLDTFIYRKVGKKIHQSQIDFINKHRDQFTVVELAKRFNCSTRSVDRMIKEIKNNEKNKEG